MIVQSLQHLNRKINRASIDTNFNSLEIDGLYNNETNELNVQINWSIMEYYLFSPSYNLKIKSNIKFKIVNIKSFHAINVCKITVKLKEDDIL